MRTKAPAGLTLAALTVLACCEYPGGMPSSYPAADGDPRLTRVAATALPCIRAISAYQQRFGVLPSSYAEVTAPAPPLNDWMYTRAADGRHYTLWQALGWDPSLRWESDGHTGQWIFDPGDGSPEKPLQLNPSDSGRSIAPEVTWANRGLSENAVCVGDGEGLEERRSMPPVKNSRGDRTLRGIRRTLGEIRV